MRQKVLLSAILAFTFAIVSAAGYADTIRVPLNQPSIKEGMSAASEGDTVLVALGTYTGENNRELDFGGVNMVVMSEAGAEQTIIDCEGMGTAFNLGNGEDSTSIIRGFTITNGSGGNGGGIYVSHAAVKIEYCVLSNNVASMNGGGIWYGYAPTAGVIRNCVFSGNSCPYRGGGISCSHGDAPNVAPVIENCVFYDNEAESGGTQGGGGIHCNSSPTTVIGCTIVGNAGTPGAGGIHAYGSAAIAIRCIIAFNTEGAGAYNVEADHCVIFGNAEENVLVNPSAHENLEIDPLFCDMAVWNLMLCSNSPCLPSAAENPWGELVGTLQSDCDECESPVEENSWGSIKAKFKGQ